MFFENCSYEKSVLLRIFVYCWRYSVFLNQLIQRTVLNLIRFLLSSLIANVEIILSNFQQKIALDIVFNISPLTFGPKNFLVRLKRASKFSLSWQRKCDVFLLKLYLAIDSSNLARKNDVTQLAELQMHVQK